MNERFTLDGSAELERHLARQCERVLDGVQRVVSLAKLEALVLGGGYGRGEGGVLKTETGDRPYNDLEFYVFLRGNRVLNDRRFRRPLAELGDALSPEAGLHVEFKVDSLARLRRAPVTMFSYDLVSGHKVIVGDVMRGVLSSRLVRTTGREIPTGDVDILFGSDAGQDAKQIPPEAFMADVFQGCDTHRDATQIPLAEATRLLFNRCTGLLLCAAKLRQSTFSAEDSDFFGRNLAKAQLAFGDAVLAAFGLFHWSCKERNKRLASLSVSDPPPAFKEIHWHHTEGVEFKLHPRRSSASAAELGAQHRELVALAEQLWLWLESRRLGRAFDSARDYAFSSEAKCAEASGLKNVALSASALGLAAALGPAARRYPRERLFHALAILLWQPNAVGEDEVRRRLERQLAARAATWEDWLASYTRLWQRFS